MGLSNHVNGENFIRFKKIILVKLLFVSPKYPLEYHQPLICKPHCFSSEVNPFIQTDSPDLNASQM